jgi:hypothetical protein
MILSAAVNSSIDFWTISFLVGSILQADELSITVVPAAANFGAHSMKFLHLRKIKQYLLSCQQQFATPQQYILTFKINLFPTERSDATEFCYWEVSFG